MVEICRISFFEKNISTNVIEVKRNVTIIQKHFLRKKTQLLMSVSEMPVYIIAADFTIISFQYLLSLPFSFRKPFLLFQRVDVQLVYFILTE